MRRSVKRGSVVIAGLIVLAFFLGPLLEGGAILVLRDVPTFHVPLRAAFADLAAEGLPSWNPRIHGGQPVLSNPNYASFYPPTWLSLTMPAHRAVSWLVALHAVFGFAGAWFAARRFGCGHASATLTAIAFIGGGSVWSALNLFCALAWLPWTLLWGYRCFTNESGAPGYRLAAPVGLALAMQVLAGEPAIALASSLAIACMAATAPRPRQRRLRRLAAVALFTVLFSAVQLLPTLDRVRDSARSDYSPEQATAWSAPPLRLVELAFPRAFGDPMRMDDDFYFGWTLHDRSFPYLISIYGGQLVLLLAVTALLRWPIRLRLFWITLATFGLALALGRYNPLYLELAPSVPFLKLLRYPEKFLVLTTTALAFAAGLGWQHLLDKRSGDEPAREDLPLALAAALALISLVIGATLSLRPELAEWFVRHSTVTPPIGERMVAATSYLSRQAWIALLLSLSSVAVFLLHRIRAIPKPAVLWLTLIVLASDLIVHNRGLTPAIPYDELARPPAHLESVDPAGGRVFTDEPQVGRDGFVARSDRPGPDTLWSSVNRAEPYIGNLWGYSYALHLDFDNMLTEPAERALDLLSANWSNRNSSYRILGSWGVGYVLRNRSATERSRALFEGRELAAVAVEPLTWRNPLLSWERHVTWHETPQAAEDAAVRDRFRRAHWIGVSESGAAAGGAPETIRRLRAGSSSTLLDYSASEVLFAVVNTTYDRGWRARLDGFELSVHRTVLGQIGLELPPGDHVVELEYRTPYLRAGTAASLLTLVGLLWAEWFRRRRAVSPVEM